MSEVPHSSIEELCLGSPNSDLLGARERVSDMSKDHGGAKLSLRRKPPKARVNLLATFVDADGSDLAM